MKKIRMIITSAIVLAIVGSAFSFKEKRIGIFCVTSNLSSTNCTTYLSGQKIVTIGSDFKYVPCWDFNTVACIAANNGLCTGTVQLATD